ncbi:MAG: tetratricopeptide repeat protein [Eudoraea sp.]|nr:tetratricopeptide repeat protein [Eudoraea sp.]
MKRPLIFIILAVLLPICSLAQDETPEELFEDGDYFFAREDYSEAAYLYRQVLRYEPDNANVKYKIGTAYLNIEGEESEAIPYLEEATQDVSVKYRKNYYKQKEAPYHSWYYLGNAYRVNNQLSEALDAYETFMSLKDFEKKYNVQVTEAEIKAVGRAKIIQDAPLNLYKFCYEQPLNSEASEYNAIISADEQVMVWMNSQKFYEAIMMSVKQDGKWSHPMNITPQVGSDGEMIPSGLSADGRILLLVKHDRLDSDIYISSYDGTIWSKAEPVEGMVNSNFTEDHASFSPDGNRIYFSSEQRGSIGGLDLFYSEKTAEGYYGPAVNLGEKINTELNETSVFVSPDGSKLIFSSEGHYNMGGYDLFYCDIREDGSFSDPVNMKYPINTTNHNKYFVPVKDGLSGIYTMRDEEGVGDNDIWFLEVIPFEETIAKSLTRLSEQDFSIQLTNKENGEVIKLVYDSIKDKITINSADGTEYGVIYTREKQ